jgi:two-component system, response regulator / RNA-binding antiterminator
VGERPRVVLVDEKAERSSDLERALAVAGYPVAARLSSRDDLRARIAELAPDVVIVDMASPDRDVLEDMQRIHADAPRPILMFVDESDADSTRAAIRAGVSAYVVDGVRSRNVRPIVELAIARFEEHEALRRELREARQDLEERKLVDRAKGIVMQRKGVGEEEAYRLLRKAAMDRQVKIAEVARDLIAVADLL